MFFTYKPTPKVKLRAKRLEASVGDGSYDQWVFDTLRTGTEPSLRVEDENRKAIIAFYTQRQFSPVWIDAEGLNKKAWALVGTLSKAAEHGLKASRYLPPSLKSSIPRR